MKNFLGKSQENEPVGRKEKAERGKATRATRLGRGRKKMGREGWVGGIGAELLSGHWMGRGDGGSRK